MLTVSVPTYGTPGHLLRRAVDSLLNQTVGVTVVVVNDGGSPVDVDSRAIVYRLPENRGRYFADAVVLRACDDGWFAVHDADDWCEPQHYAELLDVAVDGAAIAPFWRHESGRKPVVQRLPAPGPYRRFRHVGHWCAAVCTAERAHRAGGVHPDFRIGWDTMFTLMLHLTGPVGRAEKARWHWVRRQGSLTRNPQSGIGSQERYRVSLKLRSLYDDAVAAHDAGRDPAAVIQASVDPATSAEVEGHAAALRHRLGRPPAPQDGVQDASDVVVTLLAGHRPDLFADTLEALRRHCGDVMGTAYVVALVNGGDPADLAVVDAHRDVIDTVDVSDRLLGVGPATSVLAAAAAATGRRFWLHVEDDWRAHPCPGWLDLARRLLERGDVDQVRLRRADERVRLRHMVTRRPLRWTDHGSWRHCEDAHLTFNPSLLRTADIGAGWPSGSEYAAEERWHAAGLRGVAQLVPGVFAHTGEDRSLRAVTGSR